MKYLAFTLLFVPLMATAQPRQLKKPVICDNVENVIKALSSEQFKEVPSWGGTSDTEQSMFTLFVNEKNKTWTILQIKENTACVLGSGENFKFNPTTTQK